LVDAQRVRQAARQRRARDQARGVARGGDPLRVEEGVQSAHRGQRAGRRGRREHAAPVGPGAQRLQPRAQLLRVHRGRIDVLAGQLPQIAAQVPLVGREGVGGEPALDPQMAQVLLEEAAVTRAQLLLGSRPGSAARGHRVTKGSIARATNRTVREVIEPWKTTIGPSALPLRPRRTLSAYRTTRKPNQSPAAAAPTPYTHPVAPSGMMARLAATISAVCMIICPATFPREATTGSIG